MAFLRQSILWEPVVCAPCANGGSVPQAATELSPRPCGEVALKSLRAPGLHWQRVTWGRVPFTGLLHRAHCRLHLTWFSGKALRSVGCTLKQQVLRGSGVVSRLCLGRCESERRRRGSPPTAGSVGSNLRRRVSPRDVRRNPVGQESVVECDSGLMESLVVVTIQVSDLTLCSINSSTS